MIRFINWDTSLEAKCMINPRYRESPRSRSAAACCRLCLADRVPVGNTGGAEAGEAHLQVGAAQPTPIGLRWVLRDANGAWVDVNQYRHDLFEQNGLCTEY